MGNARRGRDEMFGGFRMRAGRWGLYAVLAVAWAQAMVVAGEPGYAASDSANSLVSLRRNAIVRIGGTVRTDYTYRSANANADASGGDAHEGDLSVRGATLRLDATVHPHVKAMFAIDLSGESDPGYDDDIVSEAMMVMDAVIVPGLEFFAGKGRAPYGQDITLGLTQSYAHAANRTDSPEGRVFIVLPPVDARENGRADGKALAPMRPGQFDRTFQAGMAYQWDDRWRVEIAAFQPDSAVYAARLRDGRSMAKGSDIGFAGRAWLRPIEDVTLQFSAMAVHSTRMRDKANRVDVRPDATMRSNAYSLSAGFDWRRDAWRVFGEGQYAWDWNFTDDYTAITGQAGILREFDSWRAGVVGEHLRIDDGAGSKRIDKYYALRLSIGYEFYNGAFIIGEYGHEWFSRTAGGRVAEKRSGSLYGVRVGFDF